MKKNVRFIRVDKLVIGATLAFFAFSCGNLHAAVDAAALPTNGVVVNGTGTEFSTVGNNMTVDIAGSGNRVIINYDSFNIGKDASVTFNQADANAVVLNRVNVSGPQSEIWGALKANGNVYIVNPAGVLFGANAVINVGSLVAAAGNITDDNFNAGIDSFSLSGSLENQADITANGVYLLGKTVKNSGNITTNGKTVVMASGENIEISEAGTGISVVVKNTTAESNGITNSGKIDAGSGSVLLGAGDLYSVAILNNGEITANNVKIEAGSSGTNGKILSTEKIEATEDLTISGGNVEVSELNAGNIEITSSGDVVFGETTAGTSLNASASGNISQTGSVTSAETTLSGVNITMSESGNELGNVSVSGESAKLVSSNGERQ